MTENQMERCRNVIHVASVASLAIGGGLAQLPLSDSAILVPIQISMIVGLGRVFDMELTDTAALGLTMGAVGTFFGRAISQVLVGWIPGVGNLINASTAAVLTEAVGWTVVRKFEAELHSRPIK